VRLHSRGGEGERLSKAEAAVLELLLALHPEQLTDAELARELLRESAKSGDRDLVERALQGLTAAGLVHRNGDFVVPSRAAVRCDQLLGG